MFKLISKISILTLLPKILENTYETIMAWFNTPDTSNMLPHLPKTPGYEPVDASKRKRAYNGRDTSKMTQFRFDYIMWEYNTHIAYNEQHPNSRRTLGELCEKINETMGTTKSRMVFAAVWKGRVDRADLSAGPTEFVYGADFR